MIELVKEEEGIVKLRGWVFYVVKHKLGTNEELLDKLPSKDYMALALKHLNVSIKAGKAFLKELRVQFAPYSVNAA